MVAGQCGFAAKLSRSVLWLFLAELSFGLSGCASFIAHMVPPQRVKLEDYVACDKHQSAISKVSPELCEKVNELLQDEAGLSEAKVGFDVQGRGRLQLAGKFKNEDEVEKAFALAQSVVGSEWVSPVTPGHIKVEDWQKCLNQRFAGLACEEPGDEAYSLDKKPPGPVREKYALLVGIGHFKNGSGKWDLRFADKDANTIAGYLTDPKQGGFKRENVKVLTNQDATRQAILGALAELEQRAKRDDLVVVYFSSHGTQPTPENHVNIVTYDTEAKPAKTWMEKIIQRRTLWNNSISRQSLHDFFRRVESKRVLMILDVCYSGDVFADIPGFTPSESEVLARNEEGYSTGYSANQLMQIFGAKDLVVEDNQGQAVNTSPRSSPKSGKSASRRSLKAPGASPKNWGKVIVSASGNGQRSWEPVEPFDTYTKNSYFTHHFLENLRRNKGQVQQAFFSATSLVDEAAQMISLKIEHKPSSQQPQFFSIPDLDAWNFSLNANSRR